MKKINNFEISSLIVIITVTLYAGINLGILKECTGINSWFTVIISNIIGIIPLLMYLYISNYQKDLPINQKINTLFKKWGILINIFLCLIFFTLCMTILYNINNYITSQLLYRTPHIVIAILLMSLSTYHISKGIDSITKVSFILLVFNIVLSCIGLFPLVPDINIENFMPILQFGTDKILPSAIKLSSINTLPIILISIIPKEKSENLQKYNKNIIIAYLIGCIIALSIIIQTYGVLGANLVKLFEYPEYIVYKKITLLGFLERVENIIASQWISGSYIYMTLIIYYIANNINIKNQTINKKNTIISIIIAIILITVKITIFKNNTIFHNYTKKIFPYICMSLFLFYIIISIKIFIEKRKNKLTTQ